MNLIICKNIFSSDNEADRSQAFNEAWIRIINLILNK